MKRFTTSVSLVAVLMITCAAQADTGPALPGEALAQYDPTTGEIIVSINGVNNWFVQSASFSLTGDAPSHSPLIPGSLPSDTDEIIGETSFSVATATDVSLGFVAAVGLQIGTPGDLTINWNAGLGVPLQTADVTLLGAPVNNPPTARINGPFVIHTGLDPLNITLDASSSSDDGLNSPLIYTWDLDDNGTFEISTGTAATLAISDVTSTFGGLFGLFPVSVRVFDGEFFDTASTSVVLIPEPTTLTLAAFGLLTIAYRPRSRRR